LSGEEEVIIDTMLNGRDTFVMTPLFDVIGPLKLSRHMQKITYTIKKNKVVGSDEAFEDEPNWKDVNCPLETVDFVALGWKGEFSSGKPDFTRNYQFQNGNVYQIIVTAVSKEGKTRYFDYNIYYTNDAQSIPLF